MKKILTLISIFTLLISPTFADKLTNIPTTIQQPDGSKIDCLASGDEFFNYLHDQKGFTIIQHPIDGYYYYGVREGEVVVPSQYRVNTVDPASVGIKPGAKISERLYREKREAFLAPMRTKSMTGAPTKGQVNQIAIYISFADDSVYKTPRGSYYDSYSAMDRPSLKHYFHEVSYKRLFVDTYHYPNSPDSINITYIAEHPRAYFTPYSPANPQGYKEAEKNDRKNTLLRKACEFVNSQVPETLDLDANNDGNIDNVCFVIKGPTTAWADLLWPHRSRLYSQTAHINGLAVRDYLLMLEGSFNVATLCHEFFHVLGAPDLYHYEDTGAPTACGTWDIMDQSSNHHYMGAFMKYKYGDWIASVPEITEAGQYTIYPLQNSEKNIYRIASPLHPQEYFVLEYRKREGLYESSLPSEGLVVTRINPSAGSGNASGPPDEIYVYRPGGTLTEEGSLSEAPIGKNRKSMSNGTNPSSFLYNNGNGGKGGIDISEVTIYDDSITFQANIKPLHPPVDLTFSLSDEGVSLDWLNLYTPGFSNYVVYKNGERLATTNSTQFTDPNIEESVSYVYYITASYTGGPEGESEPSNEVSFTPKGVQSLPYSEDFETASHGWTILGSIDGFRWGNADFHQMSTDNESLFLGANSFLPGHSANTQDMAITPRLNLIDYQSASIQFDYTLKRLNSGDFLRIWIRRSPTDSWVEFTKLGVSGFGPRFIWRTMNLDLPPEVFSTENQIGFQYSDTDDLSYGTGIDNFTIQGIRTGIDELSLSTGFEVFPNPSGGEFSLTFFSQNESRIRITDLQGKIVLEEIIPGSPGQIHKTLDLSPWEDGIYVIILNTSSDIYTKKLIKQ